MMRCSSRDPGILCPSFITSTPLPKRGSRYSAFDAKSSCLSPIIEGTPAVKFSLQSGISRNNSKFKTNPETSARHQKSFKPMVIVSSDSEEEEITQKDMPTSRKPKVADKAEAYSRRRTGVMEQPCNFIEEFAADKKKTARRVSRVDAILDEIVKESLKSNLGLGSPEYIKTKSDESVDALIEKEVFLKPKSAPRVTRSSSNAALFVADNKEKLQKDEVSSKNTRAKVKEVTSVIKQQEEQMKSTGRVTRSSTFNIICDNQNPDIQVMESNGIDLKAIKKPVRRKTKNSKPPEQDEDKENIVRKIVKGGHSVDLLLVQKKLKTTEPSRALGDLEPNNNLQNNLGDRKRIPLNEKEGDRKRIKTSDPQNISIYNHLLNQLPSGNKVVFKLDECDWKYVNSHEGVSICKTFSHNDISMGYIKLDVKHKLKEKASFTQTFVVVEGTGTFNCNGSQTNIRVGDQLIAPSGSEFEILNRGWKKSLVLSYTFLKPA